MPRTKLLWLVCLSVLGSSVSAHAAQILLDFQDLSNTQSVPSGYGSTADLTVLFKMSEAPGAAGPRASNFGTPGDLGIADLGSTFPNFPSEIVFTPAPGYEVSLVSFARNRGTSTLNNASFRLLAPNDAEVYALDVSNNPLTKVQVPVNSNFYSGPITFQYGATGGQGLTRIDDILLEVRSIPEPSTAVLMLGLTAVSVLRVRFKRSGNRSVSAL
jgi:hypothetical protein